MGGRTLVEPGFLTVLKSAARANALAKAAPPHKPEAASPKRHPEQAPKEKPNSPIDAEWLKLREELTRDYCRQCRAAAVAQLVAQRRDDGDSLQKFSAADAPLLPPPGSDVDAVFRFDWPGQHAAQLPRSENDALHLYYLRIGFRTKLNRMLTYYRRQMSSCQEHSTSDGIWLESLTESASGDHARSTDVLIAHAQAGTDASPNEEQELSIEILFIETGKPHE